MTDHQHRYYTGAVGHRTTSFLATDDEKETLSRKWTRIFKNDAAQYTISRKSWLRPH